MKKERAVILALALLLLLAGCQGYAASQAMAPFKFLFIDLAAHLSKDSSDLSSLWIRIIVFIAAFVLVFYGAERVFTDPDGKPKRNIAVVVSIAVALLGTIMIPANVIFQFVKTYSMIFSLVIAAAPVIICLVLAHKTFPGTEAGQERFHAIMRVLLYFLGAYVIFTFSESFFATLDPEVYGVAGWMSFGGVILVIAALWNLISMVGGGATEGIARFRGGTARGSTAAPAAPAGGGAQAAGGEAAPATSPQKAEAQEAAAEAALEKVRQRTRSMDTTI